MPAASNPRAQRFTALCGQRRWRSVGPHQHLKTEQTLPAIGQISRLQTSSDRGGGLQREGSLADRWHRLVPIQARPARSDDADEVVLDRHLYRFRLGVRRLDALRRKFAHPATIALLEDAYERYEVRTEQWRSRRGQPTIEPSSDRLAGIQDQRPTVFDDVAVGIGKLPLDAHRCRLGEIGRHRDLDPDDVACAPAIADAIAIEAHIDLCGGGGGDGDRKEQAKHDETGMEPRSTRANCHAGHRRNFPRRRAEVRGLRDQCRNRANSSSIDA